MPDPYTESMTGYRVLVLGGTGLFGGLLVKRLRLMSGLALQVAARRGGDVRLDLQAGDFAARLAALAPQAVVHCAGPFQGQDYRVAEACIAAGAHYIDLADGRDFVAGIARLDAAARSAGLLVVSGASSVPALSGAVADALAAGLSSVEQIDIGISPGNRTPRGLSTVQAILGYCGEPLPNGALGWVGHRTRRYAAPVGERLLSPCDVPDLALLPPRYPGRPSVRFGAGLELRLLHRGMNAMAALRQLGWVRNWARHAPLLLRAAELLQGLGSDAGAMHLRLRGRDAAGRRIERDWELLASGGDGPYVPTLAAAALLRRLSQGWQPPAGARPCLGLLSVDDILREAVGLQIRAGSRPSLYPRLMGEAEFTRLPAAVQRFHQLQGEWRLQGDVRTEAPAGGLARLAARLLRSPAATTQGALEFSLDADTDREVWTRGFPDRVMASTLSEEDGELVEQLGPTRLRIALEAHEGRLRMRLLGLRAFGLPCPRWLLPTVIAEEYGDGNRFHFEVSAALPLIGRVAAYRGHLDLPEEAPR
jgi:hypothetical protein